METNEWSLAEMGSEGLSTTGAQQLPIEDLSSDNPEGKEITCKFNLYYSFPKQDNGKNILFIPGGPGSIPPLDQSISWNDYTIAFFHMRGCGLSKICPSNKYDRFLRADYVIEDIERLREELQSDFWDAIWGESYGALVAQRYAYKYGTDRVKKLVLVAPPSRSTDTHDARRNTILDNLGEIIKYYRGNAKNKGSETSNGESFNEGTALVKLTNNFNFLPLQDVETITNKLGRLLKVLEQRYGSINFVIDYYNELKKRDKKFTDPYPEEFFKALSQLQFNGRPVKGLEFSDATKQLHVNAALLIAYYLTLRPTDLNEQGDRRVNFEETPSPVFTRGLALSGRTAQEKTLNWAQTAIVKRLNIAQKIIAKDEPESRRAYWVFGVYDGISRWILKIMHDQIKDQGFFRSQDIRRRITEPVARNLAQKIGMVPGEPIYPWNSGYYKHDVPTLILRGDADAVTAGGQAESFFKDGLANKHDSVLMEIPGMGHLWTTSMPQAKIGKNTLEGRQVFQKLVEKFLTNPSTFLHDPEVKTLINAIGISVCGMLESTGATPAKLKVGKLERKKQWDAIMKLRRRTLPPALEKIGDSTQKLRRTKSFGHHHPKLRTNS